MAWLAVAQTAASVVGSFLGGSDPVDRVPGQTSDSHTRVIFARMTAAERQELQRLWDRVGNESNIDQLSAFQFSYAVNGGSDGRVTSSEGKALNSYWKMLERKYPDTGGVTQFSTGQELPPASGPLSTGGQSTSVIDGQDDKDVSDALLEILKNLGKAAVETGTATVSGGLEGGVAASKGAAQGAEFGGTLFGSTTTLLLLGAVAFLGYKAFAD